MLKQNKGKLLLSTLAALSPALVGLLLWGRLPAAVPVHFDFTGTADGYAGKAFAVFGLPALLTGGHLLCLALTFADPKAENIGKKPMGLLFWIIPVTSIAVCSGIYAAALGQRVDMRMVCQLLLGVLLLLMGNLLPKVRQNYTFGIKLPWTLHDPENWNRTHRFAGWCMALSGLFIAATALFPSALSIFAAALFSTLPPVLYSFLYYQKHRGDR